MSDQAPSPTEAAARERARAWLIDREVGLMTADDVAQRADELIREIESVPDWLARIALGHAVEDAPRLDLVLERPDPDELRRIARVLHRRFEAGTMDRAGVGLVVARAVRLVGGRDGVPGWSSPAEDIALAEDGVSEHAADPASIRAALASLVGA